jgi:hypothetical protein
MRPDEEFAPLRIVKKNLTDFDRSVYRVYKSPAEFVSVEAATALEAYRESGIKNPYRIMRETRFMERLIDEAKFSNMEELIETGVLVDEMDIRNLPPQAAAQPTPPAMQEEAASVTDTETTDAAQAEEAIEVAEEESSSELSEDEIKMLLRNGEQDTEGSDTLSAEEVDTLLKDGD